LQSAEVKNTHKSPVLRKVTAAQLKTIVSNHTREFLELIFPRRVKHSIPEMASHKKYEKPAMRKLTPEQGKLLFIGHASVGDQGTKDLLELMFPGHGDPMEGSL
jgi:hypothetical protein